MSHTPGPWYVHYPDGDASGYEIVAAAEEPALAAVYDEDNAHLIAAAPALLEACKVLLRTSSYDEAWPDVMDQVAAAIALAEGQNAAP